MKYLTSKIIIFMIVASFISSCAKTPKPTYVIPTDSEPIYVMVTATPDEQPATQTNTVTPTTTPTPTIVPTPTPAMDCELSDVDELIQELDDSIQRWKDIMSVAEQTSKIALSPVVVQLQDIRRQTNAIDSPDCGKFIRNYIAIAMSYDIKSLLEFLSDETEENLTYSIERANSVWIFAVEKLDEFKKEPVATYQDFINKIPDFSNYAASDSSEKYVWKDYQMDGCSASFRYPSNIYEVLPMSYIDCAVMFSNIIENGIGIVKIIKGDVYNFSQLTSDTIRMQSLTLDEIAFTQSSEIISTHKEILGNVTAYYYLTEYTPSYSTKPYYTFTGVFITPNNEVFSFFSDGGQASIEELCLSVTREILANFYSW